MWYDSMHRQGTRRSDFCLGLTLIIVQPCLYATILHWQLCFGGDVKLTAGLRLVWRMSVEVFNFYTGSLGLHLISYKVVDSDIAWSKNEAGISNLVSAVFLNVSL